MRQERGEHAIFSKQLQVACVVDVQQAAAVLGEDHRRCLGQFQGRA